MLTVDSDGKRLEFRAGGCVVRNWGMSIEADGRRLTTADTGTTSKGEGVAGLELSFPAVGLTWNLSAKIDGGNGRIVMDSTLENLSERPISLGKACLLETDAVEGLTADEDVVCLPLSGNTGDRYIYRLSDEQCPRSSKIKAQFWDRQAGKALQVGFVSFQRADTVVEHTYEEGHGLTGLRAYCGFGGWELGPGESTPTETFTLAFGDDPYAQLEDWADLAAERCAPRRWEDAPIGWIGWSWVDPMTVERYEDVIIRNCEAIRRRLRGFPVNYVWLSLGNLTDMNPGDWLNWNRKLFPNGPKYLAARLHEMGFTWGLWCGVFWMCSLLEDKVQEFSDALLKNPDGSHLVVRPKWQYGAAGEMPKEERPCIYALDPSHPKGLAYLKEVFETYRAWGVRYYMIDFLEAAAGNISRFPYERHHNQTLVPGPEAYHRGLRVIREAAGDDTYFLSSSGPTVHNAGIVDAVRTGNDFGEGRALYPNSYFYPATYAMNSTSFWTGPGRALQNQASAYYTHRKLYINDSGNVLTVDKPLALNVAQIHATVHAMSGGPSMIGDDVDRMDEERLELIKKTLPRSKEVAFPVDLFDSPSPDYAKVFHRKIEKPWGQFDVVAVYNFGDELLREPVELSKLDLDGSGSYLVWEFWNSEFVGQVSDELEAAVPPQSVRVYRLVADTGAPVLLGTDMHLMMGEMEIDRCAWDPDGKTLSGRALRPSGERGNVFLRAPKGLKVTNPLGHWIAKDARDESLIIRCSLCFEDGAATWSVGFEELR